MIVTDGAHQIPIPHMKGGEAHFSPGRNLQSASLVIGQGEVHILIALPFSLLTAKILSFSQSSLLEVLISSTSNLTSIFLKIQWVLSCDLSEGI